MTPAERAVGCHNPFDDGCGRLDRQTGALRAAQPSTGARSDQNAV